MAISLSTEYVSSINIDVEYNLVEEYKDRIELWYSTEEGDDYIFEINQRRNEIGLMLSPDNRIVISVKAQVVRELIRQIYNSKSIPDIEWKEEVV